MSLPIHISLFGTTDITAVIWLLPIMSCTFVVVFVHYFGILTTLFTAYGICTFVICRPDDIITIWRYLWDILAYICVFCCWLAILVRSYFVCLHHCIVVYYSLIFVHSFCCAFTFHVCISCFWSCLWYVPFSFNFLSSISFLFNALPCFHYSLLLTIPL